jgi:hypothetical protein
MADDEREKFIEDHYFEMMEMLEAIGMENVDSVDGTMLADELFCAGWRKNEQ